MVDLILLRGLLIGVVAALAFFLQPFGLPVSVSVPAVVVAVTGFVLLERRLRRMPLRRLIGAAAGSIIGMIAALLIALVIGRSAPGTYSTVPFVQITILILSIYAGLVIGASKGDILNLSALGGLSAVKPRSAIGSTSWIPVSLLTGVSPILLRRDFSTARSQFLNLYCVNCNSSPTPQIR